MVMKIVEPVVNTAFEQREVSLTEEKRAIAEAIADYIPDGSTIFITIGTTVEHVARALLNHNHLRIITNSLRAAQRPCSPRWMPCPHRHDVA